MEPNENINDFKPRKWLLVILIIIALAITVVLVNGIITSRKDSKNKFFNFFNNELFNPQSAKRFNDDFEFYGGTLNSLTAPKVLDKIITNNKTNKDHLIEVTFKDMTTSDPDEIKTIKQKITANNECEVTYDYDEDGYINKATFEPHVDVNMFNAFIQFYSGSQYGTALSNLLDEVITSNKKYPDNQITIVFGEITTSDQEEIKNMKKNLDTWTKYEVSTEYDENGYINEIIIEQ